MEQTENKKLNSKTIVGIVVGIIVVVLVQQLFFKSPSFEKKMTQAASEINKTCPVMLDKETRLENTASLPDNTFQYNYTLVHVIKDSIKIEPLQEYLKKYIVNNVKSNPGLKDFRDNKTTMAYYYKDKNGVLLFKITVTPGQYK